MAPDNEPKESRFVDAKNLRSLLISFRLVAVVAEEDAEVDGSDTTDCSLKSVCSLAAFLLT
jgi:hypothetical protein